jgi:choline dehydrogenase
LRPGGEVIVASGAIGSPQLLMASGIGPSQHLADFGIDVIYDNPNVGMNLQDHQAVIVSYLTPNEGISITSKLRLFGFANPLPILKWFLFKCGLLTSVGYDHGAFVTTNPFVSQPDLQVRFLPAFANVPDGVSSYTPFRFADEVGDGYTFQNIAIRGKSHGSVRLASSNTHVKPRIDGGYLSNSSDLATLREGVKLSRMLGQRQEWAEYLGEEIFPGKSVKTDADIDEYIRTTLHSAGSLVGTCRMGIIRHKAVVGPDLRVIGVHGVRVCDSSIIPQIVGASIGTPTVMIADRAAAMIKNPDYVASFETLEHDADDVDIRLMEHVVESSPQFAPQAF